MHKIILNADDFGANDGFNSAVELSHQRGALNSASLMVYGARAKQAAEIAARNPKLAVGLHADFDCGFITMLLSSLTRTKKFKAAIEKELRAQIAEAKRLGIARLSHLDSHRHVHMIPAAFSVFRAIAAEYKISRVRVVNENFFRSFWNARSLKCVWNLGWMKWGVLTVLRWMSGRSRRSGRAARTDTYFYGLTYTGELYGKALRNITVPKEFNAIEIGFHPSAFIDSKNADGLDAKFYNSENRVYEFDALMNPDWLESIKV